MKDFKNMSPHYRRVIEDLIVLLRIDNEYRGPKVLAELNHLIGQIKNYYFHPLLLPIIEYYTLIAKYGLNNLFPKTLVSTPVYPLRFLGGRCAADESGVVLHLVKNELYVLIHEMMHAVIYLIEKTFIPSNNCLQWQTATEDFLRDYSYLQPEMKQLSYDIWRSGHEDFLSQVRELPAVIVMFLLSNGRFPDNRDGVYSSKDRMKSLFQELIKSVKLKITEFKQNLPAGVNKIKLYFLLNTGPSSSCIKKHMVNNPEVGFHPLHILFARGDKRLAYRLLSHGKVSMEDKDSLGNCPLHAAIQFNRENMLNLGLSRLVYSPLLECDETKWAPLQRTNPILLNKFMQSIGNLYHLLKSVLNETQLAVGTNFIIYLMCNTWSKDQLTSIVTVSLNSLQSFRFANLTTCKQYLIYNYQRQLANFTPPMPVSSASLQAMH